LHRGQRCDLRLTLDGTQLILAINLRLMARGILFIVIYDLLLHLTRSKMLTRGG
jgi:hypothetical protein